MFVVSRYHSVYKLKPVPSLVVYIILCIKITTAPPAYINIFDCLDPYVKYYNTQIRLPSRAPRRRTRRNILYTLCVLQSACGSSNNFQEKNGFFFFLTTSPKAWISCVYIYIPLNRRVHPGTHMYYYIEIERKTWVPSGLRHSICSVYYIRNKRYLRDPSGFYYITLFAVDCCIPYIRGIDNYCYFQRLPMSFRSRKGKFK